MVTVLMDNRQTAKTIAWTVVLVMLPVFAVLGLLPWGLERIAAITHAGEESFLRTFRPEFFLAGLGVLALPYYAIKAFRERNTFKWLSIAAFIAGLLLVFSVDFIFHDVLQDHQRKRIEVLPEDFVKFGLIPEFIGRVPVPGVPYQSNVLLACIRLRDSTTALR